MRDIQGAVILTAILFVLLITMRKGAETAESAVDDLYVNTFGKICNRREKRSSYVFKHTGESVNLTSIHNMYSFYFRWTKTSDKQRSFVSQEKYKYFEQLEESDTGVYEFCNAQVSITFFLSVDTVMDKEPLKNQTAELFSNVVIPCNAIDWITTKISPITMKWFKGSMEKREDDIAIALNSNSAVLSLQNVTQKDEGWYTCEVNTSFVNNNRSIYVRVLDGFSPTIVAKEDSTAEIYRQIGDSISFTCKGNGLPEPINEWYRYIKPDHHENLDHHEHFMMIPNLTTNDTATYECRLENRYGTATHNFTVIVGTVLNITEETNSSAILNCKIEETENLEQRLVEWVKFKVDPNDPRPLENVPKLKSNATTDTSYNIQDLSHEDDGWYTCITKDSCGASYRTMSLKVVDHKIVLPAANRLEEQTVSIATGESVALVCEATSSESFIWTKGNQKIQRTARAAQYSDTFLVFENASYRDAGKYQCKSTKDASRAYTFWLIVDTSITFNSMKNASVAKNTQATFHCETIFDDSSAYNDKFNIEWYWIRDNKMQEMYTRNPNVLEVEHVTEGDEGEYMCVVDGRYSKSAFLRVTESISISLVMIIVVSLLGLLIAIYYVTSRYLKRSKPDLPLALEKLGDRQYTSEESECPYDTAWELPRAQLQLGEKLGEGAFGLVFSAQLQQISNGSDAITQVAVKMLKEDHSESDVKDLLYELKMLKLVGNHPNIIRLLGCCTQGGPLYVIVEYAPHGDLLNYLRCPQLNQQQSGSDGYLCQSPRSNQLISFGVQIARGTEHLASIRCVHRDLAARNILVGEGPIMKICDFGLARDIYVSNYYQKRTAGRLPYKWMAPEALESEVYSSQSDVWSFGVLLWEIMTLGGQPYGSIRGWEEMVNHLRDGNRLERPASCPEGVFGLMNDCWRYQPEERPTFGEIVQRLESAMENGVNTEEDGHSWAGDSYESELHDGSGTL